MLGAPTAPAVLRVVGLVLLDRQVGQRRHLWVGCTQPLPDLWPSMAQLSSGGSMLENTCWTMLMFRSTGEW